jgi:hypothetical protein
MNNYKNSWKFSICEFDLELGGKKFFGLTMVLELILKWGGGGECLVLVI